MNFTSTQKTIFSISLSVLVLTTALCAQDTTNSTNPTNSPTATTTASKPTTGTTAANSPAKPVDNSVTVPKAQAGDKANTSGQTLQTIVVQATADNNAASAIDQQHDSNQLVNVRSLDQLQNSTDRQVGNAVSRLPGVAVKRDIDEVTYARIRGLDQNLTDVTFDGMRIAVGSANNSGGGTGGNFQRAVDLEILPIDITSKIELSKTIAPDQDAEAIAGTINLVAPSAFDYDHRLIELTSSGDYAFQPGGPGFQGSLKYADIYKVNSDVKFGWYLSSNYNETNNGIDGIYAEGTPSGLNQGAKGGAFSPESQPGLDFRKYYYDRQRYSGTGNFDLYLNDDNHFFLNAFTSGFNEARFRNGLDYQGLNSTTPDPSGNGNLITTTGSTQEQLSHVDKQPQIYDIVFGGDHKIDDLKVDYKFGYADSQEQYKEIVSTYQGPKNLDLSYNAAPGNYYPTVTQTGGGSVFNPANYQLANIGVNPYFSRDREFSNQANVKIPVDLADSSDLKFGYDLRMRQRVYTQSNETYTYNGATPILLSNTGNGASPTLSIQGTPSAGPSIDFNQIEGILNNNSNFTLNTNAAGNAAANFEATENIGAIYGEQTIKLNKMTIFYGVRGEITDGTYYANTNINNVVTPVSQTTNYLNVFPSIQLKYDLRPDLVARLGYSTAIARPDYSQYVPSETVNTTTGAETIGNPHLKPTTSNNLDASIEYYPATGAVLSFDAFDKELRHYIVADFSVVPSLNSPGTGVSQTTFSNVSNSRIYGIEANYRQQFTFLPSFLSGFGLDENVILNNSEADLHTDGTGGSQLPLVSNLAYNVGAFYDKYGFNASLTANYTGSYLHQVDPTNAGFDQIGESVLQLDVYAGYQVNKNLNVFIEGTNLNNAPRTFYYRNGAFNQTEHYGPTIAGGVKLDF